ncbi:MAG: hypothetical protein NDI61_12670 [Bdellovibrionaceae bacterium]|nr:hypothetical protein [Pseudobdellovibrionaceae bacterium]
MKRVSYGVLVFLVVAAYQNCSPVSFQSLNPGTFRLENNGIGYGGKPTREYFRFVPEHTCEQKSAPKAVLAISSTDITLTENKLLQCGVQTPGIDPQMVESSPFQGHVVGYKEGIFELQDVAPAAIPSELVEAWCRVGSGDGAIETITHYDRVQRQALTELYYQKNGVRTQAPNFGVSRLISLAQAEFANDEGFRLVIYRDRPTTQAGLFEADMNVVIEGVTEQRQVACRLGGGLDVSVWPSKTLADFHVTQLKIAPDASSLAYLSPTQVGSPLLYSLGLDVSSHQLLSPLPAGSRGVRNFLYTPDSQRLVFDADLSARFLSELFQSPVLGGARLRLSSPIVTTVQSVRTDFHVTSDGSRILFRDGSHDLTGDPESWLKVVPIAGGSPTTVLKFTKPDEEVSAFGVTSDGTRVAFLGGHIRSRIYSARSDGSEVRDISPSFMIWDAFGRCTGLCVIYGARLFVPPGGDFVVTEFTEIDPTGSLRSIHSRIFAIALDGSWNVELPGRPVLSADSFAMPVPDLTLLSDGTTSGFQNSLFNVRTLAHWKVGLYGGFLIRSKRLLHSPQVSESERRYASLDLTSGQSTWLCPNVEGVVLGARSAVASERIALLVQREQMLEIYWSDPEGTSCQKAASVPAAGLHFESGNVIPSPDETRALIHLARFGSISILIHVPLDGTPSHLITMPTSREAKIKSAMFVNGSSKVLFYGDQTIPGVDQIYLWTPPKTP